MNLLHYRVKTQFSPIVFKYCVVIVHFNLMNSPSQAATALVSVGQCFNYPMISSVVVNYLQPTHPIFNVTGATQLPMNADAINFMMNYNASYLSMIGTAIPQQLIPLNSQGTNFVPNATPTIIAAFNSAAPLMNPNAPSVSTAAPITAAQYPNLTVGMINPHGAYQNPPHPTEPIYVLSDTLADDFYTELTVPSIYWKLPRLDVPAPISFNQSYLNRDTTLLSKICRQVDHYFSAHNLKKDSYLKKQMDSDGWVNLSVIARLYRMVALTSDLYAIASVSKI